MAAAVDGRTPRAGKPWVYGGIFLVRGFPRPDRDRRFAHARSQRPAGGVTAGLRSTRAETKVSPATISVYKSRSLAPEINLDSDLCASTVFSLLPVSALVAAWRN